MTRNAYAATKEWRKKNPNRTKLQWTRKYKRHKQRMKELKNKPCKDCGKKYPYYCMDFDHVKGKKLYMISEIYGHSMKKILREIKKCELVCAICHRIRTQKRLNKS